MILLEKDAKIFLSADGIYFLIKLFKKKILFTRKVVNLLLRMKPRRWRGDPILIF